MFITSFTKRIDELYILGNTSTIDESLFSYYGKDAHHLKISVTIPSKPHPDGLLAYQICQRLPNSRLPIPIGWDLRTPQNKKAPYAACDKLITDLLIRTKDRNLTHHLIVDSGFATLSHIKDYKKKNIIVTAAVKQSGSKHLSAISGLASKNLSDQQSLQFYNKDQKYIYEIMRNGSLIHNTISTAWTPVGFEEVVESSISYDGAVKLFSLINSDLATIAHWDTIPIPPNHSIIKNKYGIDITKPPVGTSDTWTKETLTALTRDHLLAIHSTLWFGTAPSGKTKEELISEIIRPDIMFYDEDGYDQDFSNVKLNPNDILDMEKRVLGTPITQDSIHNYYLSHYNLVDVIDKNFYGTVVPKLAGTWQNLFTTSLLFSMVYHSFVMFAEAKKDSFLAQTNDNKMDQLTKSLSSYIITLCDEVDKKYPPITTKQKKKSKN
ncbi:hypothetical protein DLAC_11814 [Tieghemostelium lacteum]|uniref:PiggyBac transposable element-derived protein domain-containing protein n=1 Tax=Tieghemostelium lacteum TaxID=361077 RepID=A0A151Z4K5_TIELA|nr:hypothetical protein DLAC_11814 [Tieghemostelium lacteum]|eukprot:KYQ88902.1 hypothetical protein DLAC_11814 [Tieghemostelium lacteum]